MTRPLDKVSEKKRGYSGPLGAHALTRGFHKFGEEAAHGLIIANHVFRMPLHG